LKRSRSGRRYNSKFCMRILIRNWKSRKNALVDLSPAKTTNRSYHDCGLFFYKTSHDPSIRPSTTKHHYRTIKTPWHFESKAVIILSVLPRIQMKRHRLLHESLWSRKLWYSKDECFQDANKIFQITKNPHQTTENFWWGNQKIFERK
jgi:hypothetical protein